MSEQNQFTGRPGLLRRIDQTGIPLAIARLVLGLVFVLQGWAKTDEAADAVTFAKMIREYEMLPDGAYMLLNVSAVCLPWIEIVAGVLLILGLMVRGSALALFLLLTVFTVAIVYRAIGIHGAEQIPWCDIKFDCGCGTGDQYVCSKVPQNVGLWVLSIVAMLSRSRRFCLERDRFATSSSRGDADKAIVHDRQIGDVTADNP